jgi:hypothetical protein
MLLPLLGLVRTDRPPLTWLDWLTGGPSWIRCPQCFWQPGKGALWLCEPGCGHCWNTFETRGVCPDCDKRWHETACLKCGAWSPHADWYAHE